MKVHCQYSGITYDLTGFGSTQLTYVHPIFTAEPKWLLSRMGSWSAMKYTTEESSLLFLGLLHSTGLVEFRVKAEPTIPTVMQNMEQLARFVGWMCGLSNPHVAFPKFVISHENRTLGNVRYWIKLWQEAKEAFESGYTTQHVARQLRDKEAALERLIRNAGKSVDDYAGLLATWALQASGAPNNIHEYWRSLFCLKGVAVYNARQVDLEELVEHMEEHLEHGSIFAFATLSHLRSLHKRCKAGLNYGLGITDEEFAILETSPFKIVDGSVEQHNMDVIAASAPLEEPNAKDFPSRVAYLRAQAAWKLASRARAYAAEFTQQVEEVEKQDEQDRILDDDAEDTEGDDDFTSFLPKDSED
jgi:hypothetical protein